MSFVLDLDSTEAGDIRLAVIVDDEAIWPHPEQGDGGADFDSEDVLSYLVDAWPSLALTQSLPIAFAPSEEPRSITGLLRAAEDRWERAGDTDPVDEAGEAAMVDAFLYCHDLSQMKHGAKLKSCFMLRQQASVRLETNERVYDDIDFGKFIEQLTHLGIFAAGLLECRNDETAKRLIGRWQQRDRIDPALAAALLSGLPQADMEAQPTLVQAIGGRLLSAIANDNRSPIYAAARSSGILGPASMAEILDKIRAIADGDVTALANLRRTIQKELRAIETPLEQGIRAANFVRDWLRQSDGEPVDLEGLSKRLGIRVEQVRISDGRLDGIASTGPEHGPAILLNLDTRRQGAGDEDLDRSLRFTWAHEIGHLLLDQGEWPALVDAARQRVPRVIETRANAFAAYLLLPQSVAYRAWEQAGQPLDWPTLEGLLNHLTGRFGMPRIVASRQLARGAPLDRQSQLKQVLRRHVELGH